MTTMDLFPSIDVLDGRVVRLLRGAYDAETVYGDDPVAVARDFAEQGARWIHVVDLNAARDGGAANLSSIEAICANVSAKVQSGGGVRSVVDASERFSAGVHRVVIGSSAIEHPEVVDELASLHPGQIAVGLDARARDVAIHGWTNATGLDLVALAERFGAIPGVGALVVTGIDVDGTLTGPDVEPLSAVLAAVETPLIASGGVGALTDLQALASVSIEGRRFAGAIVGRAIYENRFTVREGIAACSQSA
jgi:phosphoribosylformimino-5-aminoimidazole carboxamide ribotide isomerase